MKKGGKQKIMSKKELSISVRKTAICPSGSMVLNAIDQLENGEFLKIKTVIGKDQINGGFGFYVNEEAKENLYGISHLSNVDPDKLAEMMEEGTYEIRLYERKGSIMHGVLCVEEETGEREKTHKGKTLSKELLEAIDDAVRRGVVTKEEMDRRMKVFKENEVDDYLIERIVKKYRVYQKPIHIPSCIYVDPYLCQSKKSKTEGIISEGLRAAADRSAIICEGEKSVGKNVYLETIAWLMGMPMYLITFSRQMSPSSIYGEKTTDNSAAKGLAEFDPEILMRAGQIEEQRKYSLNAMFRKGLNGADAMNEVEKTMSEEQKAILMKSAMFKKLEAQSASVNIVIDQSELYDWLVDGGILVFNEMNMAEANFFASFTNQLLDGTGFLFIPGRGEVRIHKDCVLFGTQNADYQGVEMQNEATMSRFGCIVFKQPDSIKGQLVAATNAAIQRSDDPAIELPEKYFDQCEAFYKQCQSSVKKAMVTNACLNIRGFVRALTRVALSHGYASLKRQLEIEVINTCITDDRIPLCAVLEQIVTL